MSEPPVAMGQPPTEDERPIEGQESAGNSLSAELSDVVDETTSSEATVRGNLNIPLPTLGGKQFWTDHRWDDGWRLQQNALTGHWRLLSPRNTRYAWGSLEACQAAMTQHVMPHEPDTRMVVLLHGLMRSSGSMSKMATALEGAEVGRPVTFEYASTRRGIAEHAAALRQWLESLPGEPRIDFVAHSMGNIVVRRMIADYQRDGDPRGMLKRFDKMVMLGPPNQGADIARQLGRLGLFEMVTGQGGMELGPAWEKFSGELAVPPFPFMIVAGDMTESWIRNPLVSGPSDLVVRVEEAKLDGCVELKTVPVLHSFLMNDPDVQRMTVEFLKTPCEP